MEQEKIKSKQHRMDKQHSGIYSLKKLTSQRKPKPKFEPKEILKQAAKKSSKKK